MPNSEQCPTCIFQCRNIPATEHLPAHVQVTLPVFTAQQVLNGRRSDKLQNTPAPQPPTRNFLLELGFECILDGSESSGDILKFLALIGAPWIEELTDYQSFIKQRHIE